MTKPAHFVPLLFKIKEEEEEMVPSMLSLLVALHCLLLAEVDSFTTTSLHIPYTSTSPSSSSSLCSSRIQTKEKLEKFFDSDSAGDEIFICPQSLSPLKKQTRIFGLISEKVRLY